MTRLHHAQDAASGRWRPGHQDGSGSSHLPAQSTSTSSNSGGKGSDDQTGGGAGGGADWSQDKTRQGMPREDWSSLLPPDVQRRNTRGQPLLYSTKPAAFGEKRSTVVFCIVFN
eukprot:COSAG06_NODE_417_length_15986_cov_832.025493_6_plen_114_part_00